VDRLKDKLNSVLSTANDAMEDATQSQVPVGLENPHIYVLLTASTLSCTHTSVPALPVTEPTHARPYIAGARAALEN
jgi:hypothetical protein